MEETFKLSYFKHNILFDTYESKNTFFNNLVNPEVIYKIKQIKDFFEQVYKKISDKFPNINIVHLSDTATYSSHLSNFRNDYSLTDKYCYSYEQLSFIRKLYDTYIQKNMDIVYPTISKIKQDLKHFSKYYLKNTYVNNFSFIYATKYNIPICTVSLDRKYIFLNLRSIINIQNELEDITNFINNFEDVVLKWLDLCLKKLESFEEFQLKEDKKDDCEKDVFLAVLKNCLNDVKYDNNIERILQNINCTVQGLFKNNNKDTLEGIQKSLMYKKTIEEMEEKINKQKNKNMLEGLGSCINIISGIMSAGYIYDELTNSLTKHIKISPMLCYKGGKLFKIKEEFRKYYIEDISINLTTEALKSASFYTPKHNHPNVNMGNICTGEVKNKWMDAFRNVINITSDEIKSILLNVEEALTVPNLDSSYYGINSLELDDDTSDTSLDSILITNSSKKAIPKAGRVLS